MDTERLGYIPSNILPPFSLHFPPILHILKEFFHPDSFHLVHYVPTQYNTLYSHPVSTDITPLMQIIPICTPYYSDFLSWIFTIFSFFLHNITTIVYKYINIKKSSWIDEFVVEWSCSSCAMMSTTDGVAVALRKVLGAGLLMWHHVEEAIFGQGSHSQGVAGNFYKSHCPGVAVAFAKTLPCSTTGSNFYKILTGTGENKEIGNAYIGLNVIYTGCVDRHKWEVVDAAPPNASPLFSPLEWRAWLGVNEWYFS